MCAVYVDNMEAPFEPTHRKGVTYVMCHMIGDNEAELHEMARKIGVARKWYQGDHYDITKSKRVLAVKAGPRRSLGSNALRCVCLGSRTGKLGKPETAVEDCRAQRKKQSVPSRRRLRS